MANQPSHLERRGHSLRLSLDRPSGPLLGHLDVKSTYELSNLHVHMHTSSYDNDYAYEYAYVAAHMSGKAVCANKCLERMRQLLLHSLTVDFC